MSKLGVIALLCAFFVASEASAEPPNVVVFFIDDMGYADPSCFGNPTVQTPSIDRLAAEGIKLTNFYVNSPICSASRVALTTGRYQQRYRIHSYFASRQRNRARKMPDWLDPSAPTLAKVLKAKGYHTAHFGKWHMGGGRDVGDAPLPQAYGFDESLVSFEGLGDRILWNKKDRSWQHDRGQRSFVEKHKTTQTYVDRAIDFVQRHKNERFYVRVFPNDVHDAHVPSAEQLAKWSDKSKNEFDAKFFAVLEEMDRQIGRVLDALDRLKLTEKTIVIFTSDNGPTDWPLYYKQGVDPPGFTGPLFGRKWSLYEGGIRMPFIARWTGTIPAGETNDTSVVAAMDLLPSIAALTESTLPKDVEFDGEDMSAALLGQSTRRAHPICWEYGVHGSIKPGKPEHVSPHLAIRDGNWKLLCDPDGAQTKLFDLGADIGEMQNVASMNRDRVDRMKSKLLHWWHKMDAHYSK